MKIIQTIIILIIIGLFAFIGLKGCSYLDLKVSEKYETQLEGITKSPELLQEAKEKAVEIEKEKKRLSIQAIVSLILILILLFVYLKIRSKSI